MWLMRCVTGPIRTAVVARGLASYQHVEVHSLRRKSCSLSKISREMFLPGYVKITVIVMRFLPSVALGMLSAVKTPTNGTDRKVILA